MTPPEDSPTTVITGAARGRSADASRRQRNYLIMMGIRVLCFVGLLFAPGNTKWVLLAGAVVLPYIAVLVVNQGDQRHHRPEPQQPVSAPVAESEPLPAVAAGDDVIEGEVVPDGPRPALTAHRTGADQHR